MAYEQRLGSLLAADDLSDEEVLVLRDDLTDRAHFRCGDEVGYLRRHRGGIDVLGSDVSISVGHIAVVREHESGILTGDQLLARRPDVLLCSLIVCL